MMTLHLNKTVQITRLRYVHPISIIQKSPSTQFCAANSFSNSLAIPDLDNNNEDELNSIICTRKAEKRAQGSRTGSWGTSLQHTVGYWYTTLMNSSSSFVSFFDLCEGGSRIADIGIWHGSRRARFYCGPNLWINIVGQVLLDNLWTMPSINLNITTGRHTRIFFTVCTVTISPVC